MVSVPSWTVPCNMYKPLFLPHETTISRISANIAENLLFIGVFGLLGGAFTLQFAQYDLTHTHALGSNLNVLVILNVLQSLLK